MKRECCVDSLSMVDTIVPNVLSFLHGIGNEDTLVSMWLARTSSLNHALQSTIIPIVTIRHIQSI